MTEQMIKLDEVNEVAARDALWPMRAQAIQGYANLEQSLSQLFSQLAGITPDIGGIIFFKIASASARNAILEKLINKRYGNEFNLFWNECFKSLRTIDRERNEIVHWNAVNNISGLDDNGHPLVSVSLDPPNFWDKDENTPSWTTPKLYSFLQKCSIFSRLINMFTFVHQNIMTGEQRGPWLDIFRQPLVYPLPEDHPLNSPPSTPDTPPQSSQT